MKLQGLAVAVLAVSCLTPDVGWTYDTHGTNPEAAPTNSAAPASATGQYDSVAIVQPGEQATVHNNNDSLAVEIAVTPQLRTDAGDQIVIMLDGVIATTAAGSRFQLANVVRGAHTIQALVVDHDGTTLLASQPVHFSMWHASSLFPHPGMTDRSPK